MKFFAGPIQLQYQNGCLRSIRAGDAELLQLIYFAVRDKDWRTIPFTIEAENILQDEEGFHIGFKAVFRDGPIQLDMLVEWMGFPTGRITGSFIATALHSFERNRIGFCVHHPIAAMAGQKISITGPEAKSTSVLLPLAISPWQPAKNIRQLNWEQDKLSCRLAFEAELFEMEDQRNWTDFNFKTYGTPLSIPYPVQISSQEQIEQRIVFNVEGNSTPATSSSIITISSDTAALVLPEWGVCNGPAALFSPVPSFIRYDHNEAVDDLKQLTNLLKNTPIPVALQMVLTDNADIKWIQTIRPHVHQLHHLTLAEQGSFCCSQAFLDHWMPLLKNAMPQLKIGTGSSLFYAEWNRSGLDARGLDFISFPANPQVHASDENSIVENLAGLAAIVSDATEKYSLPVFIDPLTLSLRVPGEIHPADPRRSSAFGNCWALAAFKQLAESGAAGICFGETEPTTQLAKVLEKGYTHIHRSVSTDPLLVQSMVLLNADQEDLYLINFCALPQQVKWKGEILPAIQGNAICKYDQKSKQLIAIPST